MPIDFICIGAQKAATSWLHMVLSAHPQILASQPKELNYFTANYDCGALWYESHFAGDRDGRILGECSPNYFCSIDAPIRAHDYNPDLKLIACLRDPVARTFSNHLHELRVKHIPPSTTFRDALAANPAYLDQSRYKQNLERWIELFGRDRLLILFAEEIATRPEEVFTELSGFLGISDADTPAALRERSHESVAFRHDRLQRVLRAGGDAFRRLGMHDQLKRLKSAPGISQALNMNKRDLRIEVPPLDPEMRAELAALFAPDMAYVADLVGRADLPWESRALAAGEAPETIEALRAS